MAATHDELAARAAAVRNSVERKARLTGAAAAPATSRVGHRRRGEIIHDGAYKVLADTERAPLDAPPAPPVPVFAPKPLTVLEHGTDRMAAVRASMKVRPPSEDPQPMRVIEEGRIPSPSADAFVEAIRAARRKGQK